MPLIKTLKLVGSILGKKSRNYHVNNATPYMLRAFNTNAPLCANVPFLLSDIGEGIREVVVKEWFVKEGDSVAQFDNICEVQSDKASVTITSRYDGIITKLHYGVDDTALVGKPLVDIDTDSQEEAAAPAAPAAPAPPIQSKISIPTPSITTIFAPAAAAPITIETGAPDSGLCIPSVRRLAKEHAVDLTQVTGTGKQGRILKEDVLKFLELTKRDAQILSAHIQSTASGPQQQATDRIEKIQGFRKAMVQTMTESLKIPHFVYSDEVLMTKLFAVRASAKEECEALGVKLSPMPFLIKAASNALSRYPVLNATVDAACETLTYKGAHNIGVAMDTKVGLAVPVIRNVQHLNVVQIARELNRLMASGKIGSFNPSDLSGGTFTISNIGAIGGTYVKPIILPPQVAILAIGAAQLLPRYDANMALVPEQVVALSGSADHRVVDGAAMALFVRHFKKQIENPDFLFMDL